MNNLKKSGILFILSILLCLMAFRPQGKPWSVRMANSEMKRFPQSWMLDNSAKPKWGYCQGLVCRAMMETSKATGNKKFFAYAKSYADTLISAEGTIKTYQIQDYNLDQINAGRILFDLYRQTGGKKYLKALETLRDQVRNQPRTSEGGFWHKKIYPYQMWLDGLYMASPFLAQYAKEFNEPRLFDEVVKQITLVAKHTYDPKTGLYYHGWDEKHIQNWANPQTGTSSCFWGRSVGWYAMAMVDVLDYLPKNHAGRNKVIRILKSLAPALAKVQDGKTGLWYQVLDQGGRQGNYLEASCSSMFVYALAKAAKKGYIEKKYLAVAQKGYDGLLKNLIKVDKEGTVSLVQCCAVAGLSANRPGTYDYYIHEKICENDPKATGSFILASLELGR
ncbi:MAG: glycoside hydrolase family 88 protein [Bacteroidota bacterium]|nr:glycoside hydrolase family 88 protein [Bacteroidota bacterium]MDP4273217.1 glycoside hydrolase family 88 protein [Bacteroidota bacterium]